LLRASGGKRARRHPLLRRGTAHPPSPEGGLRRTGRAFARLVPHPRRPLTAWRLDTLCRDEGEAANQRIANQFQLRVDGDKLVMRDVAGIRNFTRCPP